MKHARNSNLHYSFIYIYIDSITKTKEYNINISTVMMEFEPHYSLYTWFIQSLQ
jgi:hypothetical protein